MDPLRIIIDTREQRPWRFPPEAAVVRRGTLSAGDYALEGDTAFAIERKSLDDFIGTTSSGWERFQRELERMGGYAVRCVIVEGALIDILMGRHNHPMVTPAFILKRIAQLTLDGVSVLLADGSRAAAGLAYAVLRERHHTLFTGRTHGTDQSCNAGLEAGETGLGLSETRQSVDHSAMPRRLGAKLHRQRGN
jgi:ERCC4-type nuclease